MANKDNRLKFRSISEERRKHISQRIKKDLVSSTNLKPKDVRGVLDVIQEHLPEILNSGISSINDLLVNQSGYSTGYVPGGGGGGSCTGTHVCDGFQGGCRSGFEGTGCDGYSHCGEEACTEHACTSAHSCDDHDCGTQACTSGFQCDTDQSVISSPMMTVNGKISEMISRLGQDTLQINTLILNTSTSNNTFDPGINEQ